MLRICKSRFIFTYDFHVLHKYTIYVDFSTHKVHVHRPSRLFFLRHYFYSASNIFIRSYLSYTRVICHRVHWKWTYSGPETSSTTTSNQSNIFNKILKGSLLSFSGFVFLCLLFNSMFVVRLRLRLRVFFFVYSTGMFTLVMFTLYTFAFFPARCCLVFINLYLPQPCRSSGLGP